MHVAKNIQASTRAATADAAALSHPPGRPWETPCAPRRASLAAALPASAAPRRLPGEVRAAPQPPSNEGVPSPRCATRAHMWRHSVGGDLEGRLREPTQAPKARPQARTKAAPPPRPWRLWRLGKPGTSFGVSSGLYARRWCCRRIRCAVVESDVETLCNFPSRRDAGPHNQLQSRKSRE